MTDDTKIALITGASRGIGKASALALGHKGMFVVGTATTEAGAETITKFLREAGVSGKGLIADVSDADSVAALIEESAKLADALRGGQLAHLQSLIIADNPIGEAGTAALRAAESDKRCRCLVTL